MKIKSVEFSKSIFIDDSKIFFDNKNEIVFIGRSNVGKSTLINTLVQRKNLVKTSRKPGKTKTANLFLVNNKYYFTDLPGYGFAKLGKEVLEKLDALISWYIDVRKEYIKTIVLIIDSRIGLKQIDKDMFLYAQELNIPLTIVLSKIDKITRKQLTFIKQDIQEQLFGQKIFAISSLKKEGTKELFNYLTKLLEGK